MANKRIFAKRDANDYQTRGLAFASAYSGICARCCKHYGPGDMIQGLHRPRPMRTYSAYGNSYTDSVLKFMHVTCIHQN